MDGFDPLTCSAPSRSRVDEDDEEEAEAAAQAHPPAPPLLTLTPSARAAFADDKARTPLLVRALQQERLISAHDTSNPGNRHLVSLPRCLPLAPSPARCCTTFRVPRHA